MAEEKKKKPRSAADVFSPRTVARRELQRYFPNTFQAGEERVISARDARNAGNAPQEAGQSVAAPFAMLGGLGKDLASRLSTPFSPIGIPQLFGMAAQNPGVNSFVEGLLDMPARAPQPTTPAAAPTNLATRRANPEAVFGPSQGFDLASYRQKNKAAESRGGQYIGNEAGASSAFGPYQFTRGTWISQYRKSFGNTKETDDQILAKRMDPATNDRLFDDFTNSNLNKLRAVGAPVNEGNAYLAHFLGAGDAAKVLKADPNAPIGSLVAEKSLAANPSVFAGIRTARDMVDWAARKMGSANGAARPGFSGGFDPAAFDGQMRAINDWGAAHTPFDAEFDLPARPELPDAPKLPERDFAAQDQALAELKPIMMSELETKRVTRANMFSGLAKGLASIPEGAGVGTVLAQLGAGMLAGRGAADAEIQARMDKFDEKMTAWKMLNLRNESEKANLMHQDAVKEVEVMYQHNWNNYRELAARYNADNNISMQGNYIVFQSRKGDKGSIHAVPFTPAVNIGMASMRAGVMGNMADAQTRSSQLEAAATNQVIMSEYTQQARTAYGGRQGMEALVAMPSIAASEIVSNGWISDIFGPEEEATLMESARASVPPGSEMTESGRKRFDEVLAGKIGFRIMTDPKFQERVGIAMPGLVQSYTARRYNEGQTTTTYGPKGVTTRQEY